MTKTNVQSTPSNPQRHDTSNNKTHIIKFRVTETEKMELQCTAKLLHLSLSTLIRRALHSAKIERTVVVVGGGEETLTAVSTLLAQCSRVAAISTNSHDTSTPAAQTPNNCGRNSLTNLQT